MDWKLFFSTFALIFFAELGDKTQLAAMASAAGATSTRAVFFGASAALVFSTFLAVVAGTLLNKYVPASVIKTIAGVLFLIFGVLLLWSVYSPSAAEAEPAPETAETSNWLSRHLPAQPGQLLSRVVLEAALQFEKSAAEDYEALARNAQNESLRALFLTLAAEERRHFDRVQELTETHAEPSAAVAAAEQPIPRYLWENGKLLEDDALALAAAIAHEKAKVEFYRALGDSALIPSVKSALHSLADEEADHMKRLQAVA